MKHCTLPNSIAVLNSPTTLIIIMSIYAWYFVHTSEPVGRWWFGYREIGHPYTVTEDDLFFLLKGIEHLFYPEELLHIKKIMQNQIFEYTEANMRHFTALERHSIYVEAIEEFLDGDELYERGLVYYMESLRPMEGYFSHFYFYKPGMSLDLTVKGMLKDNLHLYEGTVIWDNMQNQWYYTDPDMIDIYDDDLWIEHVIYYNLYYVLHHLHNYEELYYHELWSWGSIDFGYKHDGLTDMRLFWNPDLLLQKGYEWDYYYTDNPVELPHYIYLYYPLDKSDYSHMAHLMDPLNDPPKIEPLKIDPKDYKKGYDIDSYSFDPFTNF